MGTRCSGMLAAAILAAAGSQAAARVNVASWVIASSGGVSSYLSQTSMSAAAAVAAIAAENPAEADARAREAGAPAASVDLGDLVPPPPVALPPDIAALTRRLVPPVDSQEGLGATAAGWTLDALVDAAVRNNPRVAAQKLGVDASRQDIVAARWQYFPTPSASAEGGLSDRQLTTSLTQPIWSFGKIEADVAAARARSAVAQTRVDEARYGLAQRVIESFAQIASATRSIDVFETDLARLQELEALIGRRVESGISAPVDHNLVLARIGQTRNAITSLGARRTAAAAAIGELVGEPISADDIVIPRLAADPSLHGAPDLQDATGAEVAARSLATNPVIRRTLAETDAARADVRRARNALWPTLFARVDHRQNSGRYSSSLPATMFVVGMQLNFGAGFSQAARVRAAEAQEHAMYYAAEATRSDLRAAVAADYQAWSAARQLVLSLRDSQQLQRQTVDSYNRMFLAGRRSWLDLLNVTREQASIDRDLADAEIQFIVAAYRLRLQTGDFL